MTGMRPAEKTWPPAYLAVYLAALLWASRGITVDFMDGLANIFDSLRLTGIKPDQFWLTATRPPAGWLILTPLLAAAYRFGGAIAALKACHAAMACAAALTIWASHRLYRRDFDAGPAAAAAILLSLNPLLIHYAPFALCDVLGALPVLAFLCAWRRWNRVDDRRSWLLLFASYLAAVLTRYFLFVLFLAPLAKEAFSRRRDRRRQLEAALLPALAAPACVLAVGLLLRLSSSDGLSTCLRAALDQLWLVVRTNTVDKRMGARESLYAVSLWRQLGPGTCALASWGLVRLLRRGGERAFAGWTLVAALAALSFAIPTKEQRYLLALLPLVYAAAAAGLEAAGEAIGGGARGAAALAAVILISFPWARWRAAWRYLESEPALHTAMPWRLGGLMERETGAGECVWWPSGAVRLRERAENIERDEQEVLLEATMMPFFSMARTSWSEDAPKDCRVSLTVRPEPESSIDYDPQRVLARVYGRDGRRIADVNAGGLVP